MSHRNESLKWVISFDLHKNLKLRLLRCKNTWTKINLIKIIIFIIVAFKVYSKKSKTIFVQIPKFIPKKSEIFDFEIKIAMIWSFFLRKLWNQPIRGKLNKDLFSISRYNASEFKFKRVLSWFISTRAAAWTEITNSECTNEHFSSNKSRRWNQLLS